MDTKEVLAHLRSGGYLRLEIEPDGGNLRQTLAYVSGLSRQGEINLLASDVEDRQGRHLWVWQKGQEPPAVVTMLNQAEVVT